MKKTYSKAELVTKSKLVFKDYPAAEKLHATLDGQFFLDKNRAALHAGKTGSVIDIENDFETVEDSKDKETITLKTASADQLIAGVKKFTNIDLIETAKHVEAQGKNRKTVLAAYDARIEELETEALIATVKTIETIEAVEAAIVLETEGKNRATVLAAFDARIKELNTEE